MKEIIPLKKDIIFKTKIGEITSIDVDLDYKVKDDLISGNVLLNGTYKMTEASVIEEEFNYKVPFGVSITKKILKDSIKIEIEDFKYSINKDILSINADLELICDEEKEEINEIIEEDTSNMDDLFKDYFDDNKEITINNEEVKEDTFENINNITNSIINDNKYYTYKIYIVRDNDNIESICNKYNVNINNLKEYNDIDNIKVGDKIIIPYINE